MSLEEAKLLCDIISNDLQQAVPKYRGPIFIRSDDRGETFWIAMQSTLSMAHWTVVSPQEWSKYGGNIIGTIQSIIEEPRHVGSRRD